jgi:predicted ATP-dependent endonuclease of OLD family
LAEALLIPVLARIALKQRNENIAQENREHEKGGEKPQKQQLPHSLEDAGVAVINMDGVYFKHFMQLFCRLDGEPTRRLPMRCAGITDNDPPKQAAPTPRKKESGTNPALAYADGINKSRTARLFAGELKTFEYDLAMEGGNMKTMLTVAAELAKTNGKPEVSSELAKMAAEDWTPNGDWERRATAANLLLKRIEDQKGEFAQALAETLSADTNPTSFKVPLYILRAIAWACSRR